MYGCDIFMKKNKGINGRMALESKVKNLVEILNGIVYKIAI